jgi:hypothetical protein
MIEDLSPFLQLLCRHRMMVVKAWELGSVDNAEDGDGNCLLFHFWDECSSQSQEGRKEWKLPKTVEEHGEIQYLMDCVNKVPLWKEEANFKDLHFSPKGNWDAFQEQNPRVSRPMTFDGARRAGLPPKICIINNLGAIPAVKGNNQLS